MAESVPKIELARAHELRQNEETFRLLIDSVKDYAIFILDPNGIVTTWNAGAERIKGYRAEEIIGSHFSRFYPESEVKAGKCEIELEGAARDGRYEDEGWRLRKDGTRFWANVIIAALRDRITGELVGFAKVTRDLTDRVQAEEERLRLRQAQEANRVRDEFLATVSHELRTPLNAILGWASLLGERAVEPDVRRALDTIRRNAVAQAKLIDDVLDISRIITGKLRIEVRVTDLATVARDALEVVRPAATARQIALHDEKLPETALVAGDPARLQQVVWNLLSNAVKFTGEGGSITVEIVVEPRMVELVVSDTGAGIAPDFLPLVFERFRQADASTTRRHGGLGLGLAIARQIVELHGGTMAAESAGLGTGSTFRMRLPVRAVAVAPEPVVVETAPTGTPIPTRAVRVDGLKILVVDDEDDSRELVATLLRNRGATVDGAASMEEALALVSAITFDVIVSDIGMPDHDGHELMRAIRSRGPGRGGSTPSVALTAYAHPDDRIRALDAGFHNHIVKPVDAEELIRVVKNLATLSR